MIMMKVFWLCFLLNITECPAGWTFQQDFGSCYYYNLNPARWHSARATCQTMDPDSDLVSIHSEAENIVVGGERIL